MAPILCASNDGAKGDSVKYDIPPREKPDETKTSPAGEGGAQRVCELARRSEPEHPAHGQQADAEFGIIGVGRKIFELQAHGGALAEIDLYADSAHPVDA